MWCASQVTAPPRYSAMMGAPRFLADSRLSITCRPVPFRNKNSTVHYGMVRYGAVHYGTVHYGLAHYGTVRFLADSRIFMTCRRGAFSIYRSTAHMVRYVSFPNLSASLHPPCTETACLQLVAIRTHSQCASAPFKPRGQPGLQFLPWVCSNPSPSLALYQPFPFPGSAATLSLPWFCSDPPLSLALQQPSPFPGSVTTLSLHSQGLGRPSS